MFLSHFLLLAVFLFADPHVKVEGKRDNVLEAKQKILELLETKVNERNNPQILVSNIPKTLKIIFYLPCFFVIMKVFNLIYLVFVSIAQLFTVCCVVQSTKNFTSC